MKRLLSRVHGELSLVATAFVFLTRLPLGSVARHDTTALGESARWFPLVGLVVGTVMAGVALAALTVLPVSLAALAAITAGVLLTGAFHEDGLADVADSAGAFDAARRLEIMRDSRIGTYGGLALVLLFGWRYAALVALLQVAGNAAGALAFTAVLLTAHVLGRWTSVWLMRHADYARAGSANRLVAEGVGPRRHAEASLVAAVCLLPVALVDARLLLAWPGIVLVCVLARRRFRRAYGGITGDTLGATNVVAEVATLALGAALSAG